MLANAVLQSDRVEGIAGCTVFGGFVAKCGMDSPTVVTNIRQVVDERSNRQSRVRNRSSQWNWTRNLQGCSQCGYESNDGGHRSTRAGAGTWPSHPGLHENADVEKIVCDVSNRVSIGNIADVEKIVCDVSDRNSVGKAAQATIERFGKVHLLCNNVGVRSGGLVEECDEGDWNWLIGE